MVTNLIDIAQAAKAGGADALSLLNTYLGMKIDLTTRRPAIGNIYGGMSGPVFQPIALRLVHLVCQSVGIPVIASTGITCGADAAEYIIAGAQAVAIGSGLFPNPNAVPEVFHGLREIVASYGMRDIKELVGSLIL
jgi:dihydroorotate dehydrogenase (NAD+) catalytic subunit